MLRLGLLSTARINRAILDAAGHVDAVEVVAVASRDGERARAYAAEHGLERARQLRGPARRRCGRRGLHLAPRTACTTSGRSALAG